MAETLERYCSNCGHELNPEDQFCSNCGRPVHRVARVPTPEADRPVPPPPQLGAAGTAPEAPPQEGGRMSSVPLRGLARKLVVLLVLGGLFSYLVLPVVIEYLIAGRLQEALGTPTKPDVEVSSNFPPELLLGRIDRIQVTMDQMSVQGYALYNAQADLGGVKVSVPSLLEGYPRIETQSCSLSAGEPVVPIVQGQACLSYLGL
jgi:hypothetical protein